MTKTLQIGQQPSQEIHRFLSQNVIGTPGISAVYQLGTTDEKLDQLPKPHFIQLRRADRLLGLCCFCEREMRLGEENTKHLYVRYFSFLDALRSTPRKQAAPKGSNQIKKEIKELLTGHPFFPYKTPNLFYAYVDPNNARSALLCQEFGFEPVRQFSTYTLGHLFPKKKLPFSPVREDEKEAIRQLLRKQYDNYNFYTEDNLFFKGQYFLIRNKAGKIVAGLQANPEEWVIHSLPGWAGQFLLHVVGRLPIGRRLIQKNYRFLALDYIYCQVGHEADLSQLIESLLAHFDRNAALIVADDRSPLAQILKAINHGIIGLLKKPIPISVIAKTNDLSEHQQKHLKNHPAFLSSFDTT